MTGRILRKLLDEAQINARAALSVFRVPFQFHSSPLLGEASARGPGGRVEFHEHRQYVFGDDPRTLDWRASGRKDEPIVKVFEREQLLQADVVFDASASMFYDEQKALRSLETLAFILEGAKLAQVSLRLYLVGEVVEPCPMEGLFDKLEKLVEKPQPCLGERLLTISLRPNTLRLLISDLLFPSSPRSILQSLCRDRGRAILYVPTLEREGDLPADEPFRLVDSETGRSETVTVSQTEREDFQLLYARHQSEWAEQSSLSGAILARIPCEVPFADSLLGDPVKTGSIEANS